MRRFLYLGLITSLLSTILWATSLEHAQAAYEAGDYKEAIALYKRALTEGSQAAEVKLFLALAYLRDQDDARAFSTYLEALESVKKQPWSVSEEEQRLFDEGLELYLHPKGGSPREEAIELARRFGSLADEHPNFRLMNFLVASAHANLGMFDDFFPRFFRSYESFPDHFMAHKIKGMLHIKLMERLSDTVARESERASAIKAFKWAMEANPQDFSVYKMVVTLSPNKKGELIPIIRGFIDKDSPVPRRDIGFYVEHLLEVKEAELAQAFVERAKQWYPVSRSVAAAAMRLEESNKLN